MKIIDLTMPIFEGMPQHSAHGKTPFFLPGTRNHEAWRTLNPKSRFVFSGAPIPYLGGTGGQVRALAIVN